MPQCHQCRNPAFYSVGKTDADMKNLCLSCWTMLEHTNFLKFLQNAAMLNNAMDQMDAVMPIGLNNGRIPVGEIARAMAKSNTYNNISIQNSNVGVVNTGNLARIDAAITMSKGTETEEFGARLKDLTQAILSQEALAAETRQQLIEITQAISDQAIGSKAPSKVVVDTLFGRLKSLCSDVTVIAGATEKLQQAWEILKNAL